MGAPELVAARRALELLGTSVLADASAAGSPVATLGPAPALTDDLLRVLYRLLFARIAEARGGQVTPRQACQGLVFDVLPGRLLTAELLGAASQTLGPQTADEGSDAAEDHVALGTLHEALIELEPLVTEDGRLVVPETPGAGRKVAGSYFTPPALVDRLLDEALDPLLDEVEAKAVGVPTEQPADRFLGLTVCDPACGSGAFLVAAARRIARRLGGLCSGRDLRAEVLTRCLVGVDRDTAALELARVCLWLDLVEPGTAVSMPPVRLVAADALLDEWHHGLPEVFGQGGFDLVVGNPPFLTQLRRLTTTERTSAARLHAASEGRLGAYTDVSAVFLDRAVSWVRPGGRVALVQPQSLLAARDAAGVRAHLADSCALEALWASDEPLFTASVLTCAPVLRRGAPQGAVRRTHGPAFRAVVPREVSREALQGEWSFLVAAGLGIPEVMLDRGHGRLGDLAECTADFRDQYYGLRPHVFEARRDGDRDNGRWARLVTAGLIDPARLLWGEVPTRFLKRRWAAPVIDLDSLERDPGLARWARGRLVPKVLVGTQGRVIEAVVDETGQWLPSVPTVTVATDPDRLWHVLALLLAPPITAHAAARYAGTAMNMRAVKLSARQVAGLPLPVDRVAWDDAARIVAAAQRHPERRDRMLVAASSVLCAAYGVRDPAVRDWWLRRARLTPAASPR